MRKLPAIIGAAALLLSLAACSGQPGASGCTPSFPSGANSQLVQASGILGGDPAATFPTPLVASGVQASEIITGKGALVGPTDSALIQVSIYGGADGSQIVSTSSGSGILRSATDSDQPFSKLAKCARVNSRIAGVGTAGDLVGAGLIGQGGFKLDGQPLTAADTVVVVVDVKSVFLGRADGADQAPQSGMPTVVLGTNGQPGITLPSVTPPTDLKIATLKKGAGAAVKEGDQVIAQYQGFLWGAPPTVFDSSWSRGEPVALTATDLSNDQNGLVPGFAKALIGATVGSQVLVVIPPADGYPAGSAPSSVPAGSTMIFVFDVLGIIN